MRKKKLTHAEIIHAAAQQIFERYVDSVMGYLSGAAHDDLFLDHIEDEILVTGLQNIADSATDDFRRSIAAFVGTLVHKGIQPSWSSNLVLKDAILKYLAKHCPDILEKPAEYPKYRRINDPWEPAW